MHLLRKRLRAHSLMMGDKAVCFLSNCSSTPGLSHTHTHTHWYPATSQVATLPRPLILYHHHQPKVCVQACDRCIIQRHTHTHCEDQSLCIPQPQSTWLCGFRNLHVPFKYVHAGICPSTGSSWEIDSYGGSYRNLNLKGDLLYTQGVWSIGYMV